MEFNSDQKAVISHDEGPLLIIAGAGTGKTRVITSRILELMKIGKACPHEILALTFTEKATNEMIERIDSDLPLGYEELCIKTFHAFCDQILRESGLSMGIDPGYKVLSQVEQWFFFKQNLFEFELDYYRPMGNPNRFIYSLIDHFNKLKDELISPETYIDYSKKRKGEDIDQIRELAHAYKKYQELLIKNNYLDFGDLTFYANALFDKRESVLGAYSKRFRYIMVDEFQDTNYAQFALVLKLAYSHKNICVVGDDDQSIYKWRGASLSNILQFEKHFGEAKKVVLKENYRSSKAILDSAYELIQNNNPNRLEDRLGIQKRLICHNDAKEPVQIHRFPSFLQEGSFVAEKIKTLHQTEAVPYSDFAILVRANQYTHTFVDELKQMGIPFQVKNPKGLFSLPEIKDLLALTRVLVNAGDEISLLRILKMEVFDLSMAEILNFLNKNRGRLFRSLEEAEAKLPGMSDGLSDVGRILKDLVEFSKTHSVGLVMNEFLQRSGQLKFLIDHDRLEEIENINELAKQISKFEKENENSSVLDFVEYLNLLEEANAVFATEDFAERDSVQVLTAHGSKGLEFECVFIVNAVKGRFPVNRRSDPFEVPEELTNEIYPDGDYHLQEERRLFYVAMTRAKKRLFITYSDHYEGNKKWRASPFVEEILGSEQVEFSEHKPTVDAIGRLKNFKEPAKPIFELPNFSSSKLSFTQFSSFDVCPLQYNYRYLMKIPVPPSHATNFGSSIHSTLNKFYRLLKDRGDINLAVLKDLYEKNWQSGGYDSPVHEKIRKETGWKILERFYESNSNPWIVPVFLEKPFNIRIGDFWVNGRIDRIDKLNDGSYEVIDYKTGRFKEYQNPDKDLQLSIYSLACRDVFKFKASRLSLYYLEENKKITTTRSPEQLDCLKPELAARIQEIQKSKFEPTPGYHCQFCDFRIICPAV